MPALCSPCDLREERMLHNAGFMVISNDEANRSADDCRSQESWKHHPRRGALTPWAEAPGSVRGPRNEELWATGLIPAPRGGTGVGLAL